MAGGEKELYTFCDVSEDGYRCSTYEQTIAPDGTVQVALLNAKASIFPKEMKRQALKDQECHNGSIPRLELNVARLGAERCEFIEYSSPSKYRKNYLWCYSKCVLNWIKDEKTRFKTFIHDRLATIYNITDKPSHLNPADVCSRGINPGDPEWESFLKGPKFLRLEES
jgi:hypothetical protein